MFDLKKWVMSKINWNVCFHPSPKSAMVINYLKYFFWKFERLIGSSYEILFSIFFCFFQTSIINKNTIFVPIASVCYSQNTLRWSFFQMACISMKHILKNFLLLINAVYWVSWDMLLPSQSNHLFRPVDCFLFTSLPGQWYTKLGELS